MRPNDDEPFIFCQSRLCLEQMNARDMVIEFFIQWCRYPLSFEDGFIALGYILGHLQFTLGHHHSHLGISPRHAHLPVRNTLLTYLLRLHPRLVLYPLYGQIALYSHQFHVDFHLRFDGSDIPIILGVDGFELKLGHHGIVLSILDQLFLVEFVSLVQGFDFFLLEEGLHGVFLLHPLHCILADNHRLLRHLRLNLFRKHDVLDNNIQYLDALYVELSVQPDLHRLGHGCSRLDIESCLEAIEIIVFTHHILLILGSTRSCSSHDRRTSSIHGLRREQLFLHPLQLRMADVPQPEHLGVIHRPRQGPHRLSLRVLELRLQPDRCHLVHELVHVSRIVPRGIRGIVAHDAQHDGKVDEGSDVILRLASLDLRVEQYGLLRHEVRYLEPRRTEVQAAGPYGGFDALGIDVVLVCPVAGDECVESLGNGEPKQRKGATDLPWPRHHDARLAAKDRVRLSGVLDVDGG
mmetsp:Transcript_11037/g.27130  ORF Transcript_11037/g.27130 Transcript_11037/m.27130 type:complete len:464 (+) Transcript_11037:491-1882(+)